MIPVTVQDLWECKPKQRKRKPSGGQKGNLNALKFMKRRPSGDAPIVLLGGAGEGEGTLPRSGQKTVRAARSESGSEPFNGPSRWATGGREPSLSNLDRIIVIKTRQIGGRL